MRRGTFVAALAVGIAVPVLGGVVALSQPRVRAALKAFVEPLPAAPTAGPHVEALPPQVAITGAESTELRSLLAADAGAPTARAPRTSLFARELPAARDPFERPRGMRRSELASRDDATIDQATQYLVTDAHGHGALLASLKRSGQHRDEVERILRAWKVPPELSAIAFVESAFTPTASSLDGGVGLWSLPREVARTYGLALLDRYDERRAVGLSTEASAHYLADLHERLGSWELAIFAFGQGYARTIETMQKHAAVDYWDLASELDGDATAYVAEVLALATMLANPDRFGLGAATRDDPAVTSDLEVPAGASFATVARAAGTSVTRLRELNPEYLGDSVPDTGFVMTMHLPSAGLARAKELLMPLMYSTSSGGDRRDAGFDWGTARAIDREGGVDEAGSGDATAPAIVATGNGSSRFFYHVQDGDTLDSLARRFALSRETIASDNALDPTAGLHSGQLLLLRPAAGNTTPHGSH